MAFTEFYCDTAQSNLNAGSTEGAATVGATAGSVTGTNFAADAGTPFSGQGAGEWISVYQDGVDTETQAIGRITAVNNGGADVDVSAWLGGTPSSADRGIVGGAWAGPTAAANHPFGFVTNAFNNAAGDYPRCNFLNTGGNYAVEAENTISTPGPIKFQGYAASPGDGGRAVFDGLESGTSYRLFHADASADWIIIEDMEFQNNGGTGYATGVRLTGANCLARRVVIHDVRGIGIYLGNTGPCSAIECEAYACSQNNQNLYAGIYLHSAGCWAIRCISHHNVGDKIPGFYVSGNGAVMFECISAENGSYGAWMGSIAGGGGTVIRSEFYNNGDSGLFLRGTSGQGVSYIDSCNFIDNGGYGIEVDDANPQSGYVINCGFGAGTMANVSGDTFKTDDCDVFDSVTYDADVTPWTDPDNGDFSVTLTAAKNAARGVYLITDTGNYSGTTTAYPDLGAAQHQDAGSTLALVNARRNSMIGR